MTQTLFISFRGPDLPAGEIDLADLADVGEALQQLVLRIGRHEWGGSGPGRSKGTVERATRLRLRGLRAGSTVLDLAIGEDLVVDDGIERQTLDRFREIVSGMAANAVPSWVTPLIGESALRTLDAFAHVGPECEITGSRWPAPVRFAPARAARAVWSAAAGGLVTASSTTEISGILEAVDLKSPGRFRLRDDVGNAIPLERVVNIDDARVLIGTRVTAVGAASYGTIGQVLRLTDSVVTGATLPTWHVEPVAAAAIAGASPTDFDGVDGVDEDEVDHFLAIVRR